MQVFKAVFKIVKRHKLSIIVYMAIFFGLTLILSSNGAENEKANFSKVSLQIGVDNQDKGELGAALVEYISRNNEIKDVPSDHKKLLDAMYYQEVEYVLVIPEDFTEKFLKGERDGALQGTVVPGSNANYLTETEINKFLGTLGMYVDGGFAPEEAVEQTLSDMEEESKVEFLDASDAQEKPAAYYYFQYLPYIFLCILLISLGEILMAFNKKDMEARNKCSSMTFTQRNMQMILGSIGLALVEYFVFVVVAFIMYPDFMWSIRGVLSALNALVYLLVSLSIAFFAGRLAKNEGELNMMANVIGLGFSFLGGIFVPLEIMSEGVRNVAKFIPAYWYVQSNDMIYKMESLTGAGEIFRNCLVILAFAIAVLAAALVVNRMKARTA